MNINPNALVFGNPTSLAAGSSKALVTRDVINSYSKYVEELQVLGKMTESLDKNEFEDDDEFKIYLNLNHAIEQGLKEYKNLKYSVELIRASIRIVENHEHLLKIEMNFRGRKQQELYDFLDEKLKSLKYKPNSHELIITDVKEKIEEIKPQLKSQEGLLCLQSYLLLLENILEDKVSSKLLADIRLGKFKNYELFKKLSEITLILTNLKTISYKKDILNLAKNNISTFKTIFNATNIPIEKNTPKIFADILYLIALRNRKKPLIKKFNHLIQVLIKWEKQYKLSDSILSNINDKTHIIPKELLVPIPAFEIYQKYSTYLKY